MAKGNYANKQPAPQELLIPAQPDIPLRTRRILQENQALEEQGTRGLIEKESDRNIAHLGDFPRNSALHKRSWLRPLVISFVLVALGAGILLTAGLIQRETPPQLVTYSNSPVYSIQVGGSISVITTWQQSNGPLPARTPIPTNPGPYSVLGKPTITVAFINQVLATYNSPASGKGQALYDYGVQYGIDPVYALAFFLHESSMGTQGEARFTLSLGNIRCVPNHACLDGYSQYASWEEGFQAWYKLIRNLYVAQLGLVTIDQIIPTYAPAADNNDEQAYIKAVEHAVDVWHTGALMP